MNALVVRIEALIDAVGKATLYLTLVMIALVATNVLLRYAFSVGSVWAQELEWHLLATVILLGMSYSLQRGENVRVDVFSQRWAPRTRAWVEVAGMVVLLLPLCVFMIAMSWDYVGASWAAREGSRDPGGLPGWYLLKSLLPLSAVLLMLQALAQALRALRTALAHQPA